MCRTDEISLCFHLMLQREMIENVNGLAQYLHKDSTANVHNFLLLLVLGSGTLPAHQIFSTAPGRHSTSNPSQSPNIPNHSNHASTTNAP